MNHSKINITNMKFIYSITAVLITLVLGIACDTLQNLPTNTTGNLFSLNGTWKLSTSNDANALAGSTITVYPLAGNAVVKSIANNTYCIRKNDEMWKTVKSNGSGGFTISVLVSACNDATVYKEGIITVVTNDKITVNGSTVNNKPLIQTWERVK